MDTFVALVLLVVVVTIVVAMVLYLTGRGYLLAELWEHLKELWERLKAHYADYQARMAASEVTRQRERELGIEVGLPPTVVMDRAVELMTRSNYGIESRTGSTVTFARHEGADNCLGCFLMLFLLIPGLLYLLLAQRTARVTMATYPHEGGSRVVIGGDDPAAMGKLVEWARSLPTEPVEASASEERSELPPPAGSLADRLRELNELKDAGLITQEEYEAKRTELLDRM